jgi:hypothetical protein
MSDTYTAWRSADQQWAERNDQLFEVILRLFMDSGQWPEVEPLQRFLHQSSIRTIDVRAVADSKPSIPGQLAPAFRPSIILGCRYLLQMPVAQGLLNLTVRATQIALRKYLTPGIEGNEMAVRSDEPEIATFMPPTVALFHQFVTTDYPNAFSGGNFGPDGWTLNVNQATIMHFENVTTPQQYVERQFDMIKTWAEEQDRRQGITTTSGPHKAFVVMPFGETWSDRSYAFITKAVEAQGGALEAIRADRIDQTGRITDQIVEALHSCDIVIADITGNNANVAWELGYAYAHGKPCAIIMQQGASAPFDIYDHRRVDYSATPSADEDERLAAILRSAIGA